MRGVRKLNAAVTDPTGKRLRATQQASQLTKEKLLSLGCFHLHPPCRPATSLVVVVVVFSTTKSADFDDLPTALQILNTKLSLTCFGQCSSNKHLRDSNHLLHFKVFGGHNDGHEDDDDCAGDSQVCSSFLLQEGCEEDDEEGDRDERQRQQQQLCRRSTAPTSSSSSTEFFGSSFRRSLLLSAPSKRQTTCLAQSPVRALSACVSNNEYDNQIRS